MPYCVAADLEAAYGLEELLKCQPLAYPPADPPVLDTAAVDAAIQGATDEIDSYVMQRYRLPLAAAPAARLKRRCVDIAMYKLAVSVSGDDDLKRKRYEDALEWLEKVASGKALLESRPIAKITSDERREFWPDARHNNPYTRPGRLGRFS